MALNIYIFFTFKYVNEEGGEGGEVIRMSVDDKALETFGMLVPLIFGTFLPFAIIVFCNIWIIYTLHAASRKSVAMGVGQDGQKSREKEARYLTKMLIIVCFAYVVTSIPYRLHDLLMGVPSISAHYDLSDPYWRLRYSAQNYILHHLWEWNYAVNFYLYCIGGGKRYRQDVRIILERIMFYLRMEKKGKD
ncbi:uncharacterized protein LOC135498658 [Lineus longissimus]|uniref:uncharacterized protein LOC135498658 n=1 Tax=Lineus longissimus TaxID=88925 RepID=UPI00315D3097